MIRHELDKDPHKKKRFFFSFLLSGIKKSSNLNGKWHELIMMDRNYMYIDPVEKIISSMN